MEDQLKQQQAEGAAKTYTQQEVDELLQKETDRRVTAALKKQEQKLSEAAKLAQMSEQEKWEYQLKQREEEIARKEAALALAENKNAAAKLLADKQIPITLADFVVAQDAETMNKNIKALETAWAGALKIEVEQRLSGKSPNAAQTQGGITKEQFNKMSLAQQAALAASDRELYNALTK